MSAGPLPPRTSFSSTVEGYRKVIQQLSAAAEESKTLGVEKTLLGRAVKLEEKLKSEKNLLCAIELPSKYVILEIKNIERIFRTFEARLANLEQLLGAAVASGSTNGDVVSRGRAVVSVMQSEKRLKTQVILSSG